MTFFGSQHSPFVPAVKTFYDKWLGFNSKRTDFVTSSDVYFEQYQQGTNRRDRRYLEKERDKQRDTAEKSTVKQLEIWQHMFGREIPDTRHT